MAKECKPCGARNRMVGVFTPTEGCRKQWRVFFSAGNVRDYCTEADADAAVAKWEGRKVKLAT